MPTLGMTATKKGNFALSYFFLRQLFCRTLHKVKLANCAMVQIKQTTWCVQFVGCCKFSTDTSV